MIAAGIVDPALVSRMTILNAASVCAVLLTTNAGLVEIDENEKKEDQAKRLGFSEWAPGEYYKLYRKIEVKDANFKEDQWSDWATELHKRSVIYLSKEIVESCIREYRVKSRNDMIDRLWD